MNYILNFSILLLISLYNLVNGVLISCKGCVPLDEHSFSKLITRFNASLIKFDMAYPYGPKHEVFEKLANEIYEIDDLLVGEVGVKDYGEKENEALARMYGIGKNDLPALRLFYNHQVKEFSKKDKWSLENLRHFVKDNTNLYVGLPGCIQLFDQMAMQFIKSPQEEKQKLLKEAQGEAGLLSGERAIRGSIYVRFMEKIVENGLDFVQQETLRLGKLIKEGKIKDDKKGEMKTRLNILRSFVDSSKDEL